MTDALLTWLCSYLLHSSLLIGGLWLAERAGWLSRLATGTQETLWRLALLGGLLSASLPLLPSLPAPDPALDVTVHVQNIAPAAVRAEVQPVIDLAPDSSARPHAKLGALPLATPIAPKAQDAALGFVALWLSGALLMLVALALQWLWLRRAVRRLPELGDARWQAMASRLAGDFRVPLPTLRHGRPGWASPLLAPGRVLCLPAWCLDLPDDEARAVLGHELAHLRRRDPAWRLLAALVKALLWPQALNRIALQRLDLLAELACDAAAAAPSGQRLALAQSLLRCAEALKAHGGRHGPALACGAASAGSPLFARVRRLLKPEGDAPRERRVLRWSLVAAILVGLVALPAVVISHTNARDLLDRFNVDGFDGTGFLRSNGVSRIYSRYPGGSFSVMLDGQITFNETEDDVQTLTGNLLVREREGGLTREMSLKSMGEGRVERVYRVGSDAQPMDDAAHRWWAQAARRVSESVTDPKLRAEKLFAKGGMATVLADVETAREDFGRRQRVQAALQLGQQMDAAAQDRLIGVAASVGGGFDRREMLVAIAKQPMADAQQLNWLKAAGGIDGDFDRREALGALAPSLSMEPAVVEAWQQALSHIGGDFDLRSAIEAQVAATPQPAVLRSALQAAAKLNGDFEKREALGAVAKRLRGDEAELVQAYTQVAGGIQGGFEKREALIALLDRSALPASGLEQVIATAEGMEAGFERLQVLLRVADKAADAKPPAAGLADRLRRAGRGMGEFERGQLEKALDRLG